MDNLKIIVLVLASIAIAWVFLYPCETYDCPLYNDQSEPAKYGETIYIQKGGELK